MKSTGLSPSAAFFSQGQLLLKTASSHEKLALVLTVAMYKNCKEKFWRTRLTIDLF